MKIPITYSYKIPKASSAIMLDVLMNVYSKVGEFIENERRDWIVIITDKEDGSDDVFYFAFGSRKDFDLDSWEEDYPAVFSDGMPMNLRREKCNFYSGIVPGDGKIEDFKGCVTITAGWLVKDGFMFGEKLYKIVLNAFKETFVGKEIGMLWNGEEPFEE